MKLTPTVLAALVVILALVLVDHCAERRGEQKAEARARDAGTDTVIVERREAINDSTPIYRRRLALAQQENARLRAAVRPVDSLPDSVPVLRAQLAARNSLQAQTDSVLAITEGQRRFWEAQARTAYDSVIPALQLSRNAYRELAQRPSYLVTDVGGGAIAGWGLADRNPTVVAVGAGVVLVPRLYGAIRRIL